MKPVTPGSTPLEPGSISIVGIPTWMWAENPAALGPITRTASVPGLSLTMTAKMTGVTWNMGDGTTVECAGTGTKWSSARGTAHSPTCGHTYTKQGTYTVTSTAHWSVSWRASTGQTGVITRDLPSTSTIRVGEVQVINSKGRGGS
ncbi:PKD domain-containing protein [Janibacter hoylei]|uniref:PKD domain-containing protein n=1 Tax=Janibacter hoylei TaxID=364298 RepID=UPI0022389B6C|nr:PKD domain-containing protein [Janibacter hoylei]MCW4600244.1 PKD domain-containing protein [Janibacter hoylei]